MLWKIEYSDKLSRKLPAKNSPHLCNACNPSGHVMDSISTPCKRFKFTLGSICFPIALGFADASRQLLGKSDSSLPPLLLSRELLCIRPEIMRCENIYGFTKARLDCGR